jgi:hypothetical protein
VPTSITKNTYTPPEGYGAVDVQEVAGQHRVGLGTYELAPRGVLTLRGGWDAPATQQPLDGGTADAVPELAQLALDPHVAPEGVLVGEPFDQVGDFAVQVGPPAAVRVGPLSGDQPPMPGQHRRRGHQPQRLQLLGQQPDQRGEDGTVRPGQAGLRILSPQDRHLMAQDEDLGVLGGGGSCEQYQPAQHPAEDQIQQAKRHNASSSPNPSCYVAGQTP